MRGTRARAAPVGGVVLRFCLGKMRVCRLKAAKWRRGTGLGFFSVNPGPSSAPPSDSCHRVALSVC